MPSKRTRTENRLSDETPKSTETATEQQATEAGEPDFFTQLQRFTADEWQAGLKVYVYRTWPVIDKRDENHFLAKICEPIDEDFLLRHFGSGKYYLRLNDRRGETLNSKTVSIHNPSYAPRVSPDEVVQTDPRNERYFKTWAATTQPLPAPADTAALQELSKLATRVLDQRDVPAPDGDQPTLTSKLVDWALSQTSKEREASDPARIAALLKELKALLPQQQQPADGLALVDRVLSVVQKMNPPPAKPEREDPLEYVGKVLSLADKLRPHAPALPPEEGSSLGAVAVIVHEVSDLLKNPLTIAMQMWAASKNPTVPGAQPAAPPAQPQTQAHPTAQQGAAAAASGPLPESILVFANATTPVMLKYVHEDAPGAEMGAEFAVWVCDGWGLEDLKSFQALGAPNIIALYRQSPFWATLAPMESKFREFVEAFVKWQPPAGEPESPDGGQGEEGERIDA